MNKSLLEKICEIGSTLSTKEVPDEVQQELHHILDAALEELDEIE